MRSLAAVGEVRIDGAVVEHDPVKPPWSPKRGCVQIDGSVRIARREELADEPPGTWCRQDPYSYRTDAP